MITNFCADTDLDFQEHTSDLLAVRAHDSWQGLNRQLWVRLQNVCLTVSVYCETSSYGEVNQWRYCRRDFPLT